MSELECLDCGRGPIEAFNRCASCNAIRRKFARNEVKVQIIKPVKKVSDKRGKELLEYPKLKKNFLEHKMVCEFKFEGCTITATQIHHCSKDAKNFLNINTWMASDMNCHTICEALPAEERRAKGWLTD